MRYEGNWKILGSAISVKPQIGRPRRRKQLHTGQKRSHTYTKHIREYTQVWEKKKDKRTDREIHHEIEDFPMTML